MQRGERGVDDRSRQQVVQLGMAYGPAAGLEILAGIGDHPRLVRWPQLHIARAELLSRLGRHEEARSAYRTALDLGPPPAERAYLERRIRRRP